MDPANPNENGPSQNLIIRPSSGLVGLPEGRSAPLEEMILRSLDHLSESAGLIALEPRPGEERDFQIALGVTMRMCWCPAGEFIMGSPKSEIGRWFDEEQTHVTISRGYWIGKHPVTQSQWETIMGNNPSFFKGSNLPVESVTWYDSHAFICKINQDTQSLHQGWSGLPTEAEWEYAARSGKLENYFSNLDDVAWYQKNSEWTTHEVGSKRPNLWGIHDTLGNIWEWCEDSNKENLSYPGGLDPIEGPGNYTSHIIRGGGWYGDSKACRLASRSCFHSNIESIGVGFRIIRTFEPRVGEERDFLISHGIHIRMCWCPAGEFLMGSPESEEDRWEDENQVRVVLSKGFWMGKTQVTQAQWQAIMGNNPSYFKESTHPVECVNWHDTQEFIERINLLIGNTIGEKMTLPTEAQWEYAARASQKEIYAGGSLNEVAWHFGNSKSWSDGRFTKKTNPVARKSANAWNLKDMSGNVWEWCQDWYIDELPGGSNPTGPNSGDHRVIRGGSWSSNAYGCRVANRYDSHPRGVYNNVGFRIVRSSIS